MSRNKFECNAAITSFFAMLEYHKNGSIEHYPEVPGWNKGDGFKCKDSKEIWHTFKKYVEEGEPTS